MHLSLARLAWNRLGGTENDKPEQAVSQTHTGIPMMRFPGVPLRTMTPQDAAPTNSRSEARYRILPTQNKTGLIPMRHLSLSLSLSLSLALPLSPPFTQVFSKQNMYLTTPNAHPTSKRKTHTYRRTLLRAAEREQHISRYRHMVSGALLLACSSGLSRLKNATAVKKNDMSWFRPPCSYSWAVACPWSRQHVHFGGGGGNTQRAT